MVSLDPIAYAESVFKHLASDDRIERSVCRASMLMNGLPTFLCDADDIATRAWCKLHKRLLRYPFEYLLKYPAEIIESRNNRLMSYVFRYLKDELFDEQQKSKHTLPSFFQNLDLQTEESEYPDPSDTRHYPWSASPLSSLNEAALHWAQELPERPRRIVQIIIASLPDELSHHELRAEYQRRFNEAITRNQLNYCLWFLRQDSQRTSLLANLFSK